MNRYNVGLMIMRAQPFHIGHEFIIKQMLDACNRCVVLIGGANHQRDERNPFDTDERIQMVHNVFGGINNLNIGKINDLGNKNLWVGYVLAEIWKTFRIEVDAYFCGEGQDKKIFEAAGIHAHEFSRDIVKVSGTKIRECMNNFNFDELEEHISPKNHKIIYRKILTNNMLNSQMLKKIANKIKG